MKTINVIILILLLLSTTYSFSQSLKGKVKDVSGNPLAGANIIINNSSVGTITDIDGNFEILINPENHKELVVKFIGYISDTIPIKSLKNLEIVLKEDKLSLPDVNVSGNRTDTYISTIQPIKAEVLTQETFERDACCDLAGCFNTNASVQPTVTNVITNSQELRILGLSGVYNQTLIDGILAVNGPNFTYGISSYPGSLVKSIFISKGANSVLQGYESISGQVNVLLKDPEDSEKFFVNLFANSSLEKQINSNYSLYGKNWSNMFAVHATLQGLKVDEDNDYFLDMPLLNRYMVYNKFRLKNDDSLGFSSLFTARYVYENRIGGQMNYNIKSDKGSNLVYGQNILWNQPDYYSKTRYRFNTKNSIVLITSALNHIQDSYYGETKYTANQSSMYANIQYERIWLEENDFKVGLSFRSNMIKESVDFNTNINNKTYAGSYLKNENIPGVFAENILNIFHDKLLLITGVRVDNYNADYFLTPRGLIKYSISEKSNIRASLGTGWRTANLFSENINLLASQRDVIFLEILNPEKAINYGTNFTQNFGKDNFSGTFSADFYRTEFQNQIFPDYDSDPTKAFISNYTGKSVSNGFQVDLNTKIYRRYSIKIAYNYIDVYRFKNGEKYSLPYNSKDKVLFVFTYQPINAKWTASLNAHWFGIQKLPDTSLNPEQYQRASKSKSYTLINAQISRIIGQFDIYAGCENITNFRQEKAIISWENPFGKYFDTSSIWGPTRGREFYIGVRYKF